MPQPIDRYTWQQQVCGELGPANPTARLILMVISLHMNAQGENAWPSQATIAARARVTRRIVNKHLEIADRQGWLARYPAGRNGQGWRLDGYAAVVPDAVYDKLPEKPWEADATWQRSEPRSPPQAIASGLLQAKGGERHASNVVNGVQKGGERDDVKVVNHVLTNLPSENLKSKKTLPKSERALARTAVVLNGLKKAKTSEEEAAEAEELRQREAQGRVRKARDAFPQDRADVETLAKLAGAKVSDVQWVIDHDF